MKIHSTHFRNLLARRSGMPGSWALSLIACIALVVSSGCNRIPSAPQRPLTATEERGQAIYNQNCAVCHRNGERGPDLTGVFRKQYLPSGTPANDDRVRDVIRLGRPMMPGFGRALTTDQIDDLLAYMHTL